jgi:hypothetical protein
MFNIPSIMNAAINRVYITVRFKWESRDNLNEDKDVCA